MKVFTAALGAALALAITGCGKEENPFAIRVQKIAGDNQQGTHNERVRDDAKVLVTNAAGLPLRNKLVCFAITEGGGKVLGPPNGNCIETNADGVARVSWAVGPSGDYHTLQASVHTRSGYQVPGATVHFRSRLSTFLITEPQEPYPNPNHLDTPVDVYGDGAGAIYVVDQSNNRVRKYTPGNQNGVTVAGGNGPGSAANQLNHPRGIYVDPAGNIYIADSENHRIQKWAPGATSGITVAGGNGPGGEDNQLHYPSAVVADGSGFLYIADTENNRIRTWYPGASTGGVVGFGIGLRSIALDGAGNLYAIEDNSVRQAIVKFTPGSLTPQVVLDQITGFGFSPSDIFPDANNNLFIADYHKRRVVRVAPGTTAQVVVAGGFDQFSQALNRIDQPTGIYVDAQGAMFVADNGNNRVVKWLP